MKFRGKIGVVFWLILIGGNVLCIAGFLEPDEVHPIVMLAIMAFYNFIFLPMVIRNYVLLDEEELTVYFGFSKDSIPIADIREVYRTFDPIASSAASLDRIVIKNRHKQLMCSVRERGKLFEELKRRNPEITFR